MIFSLTTVTFNESFLFCRIKNRCKLTLVVEALDGAVSSNPWFSKIIIHVDVWLLLLLPAALLDAVVACDRQGGPRGGVLGQAEALRDVGRIVLLLDGRNRLLGPVVLVAIGDFAGSGAPARAVPAELAAERDRELSPGGSILALPLGIPLTARRRGRCRGGIGGSTPTERPSRTDDRTFIFSATCN